MIAKPMKPKVLAPQPIPRLVNLQATRRKRQCGSAGGELTDAASNQAHIWRMKSGKAAAAVH